MKEKKVHSQGGSWKLCLKWVVCSFTTTVCCTPCSVHCLIIVTSRLQVYKSTRPMRELWREESVFDFHIFYFFWRAAMSRSWGSLRTWETFFLHADRVYPAQQHLRHQDLLFIPVEKGCDTVRVQCFTSTAGCEDGFYKTALPHQFSNYFRLLFRPLPLWLADKKMAVATVTVFPETAIVSWASVEGRLKIITNGAIKNCSRRQNIHARLLLNCYPATLQALIKGVPQATPVCIYAFALTWLKDGI